MSTSIFAGLEAIRVFLLDHVANAVPQELRSEVRASAKLVADIAREVDALPALLQAECLDMLVLCEHATEKIGAIDQTIAVATQATALRLKLEQPLGSLRGLIGLHEELKTDAEVILLLLQELIAKPDLAEDARTALSALQDRYFVLLTAQANARMPWQSVFPPLPDTDFVSPKE